LIADDLSGSTLTESLITLTTKAEFPELKTPEYFSMLVLFPSPFGNNLTEFSSSVISPSVTLDSPAGNAASDSGVFDGSLSHVNVTIPYNSTACLAASNCTPVCYMWLSNVWTRATVTTVSHNEASEIVVCSPSRFGTLSVFANFTYYTPPVEPPVDPTPTGSTLVAKVKSNAGLIAGVVIGAVAFVGIVAGFVYYQRKQRNSASFEKQSGTQMSDVNSTATMQYAQQPQYVQQPQFGQGGALVGVPVAYGSTVPSYGQPQQTLQR